MDRRRFLTGIAGGAGGVALASLGVATASDLHAGMTTTQEALFALGRVGRSGDWVRLIIGSGVAYQKQIGLGTEAGETGSLAFVETQIGMPGGACNPNTLKKTYLRTSRFGTLIATPGVLACVAHSGTMLTRWADAGAGETQARTDADLRLLDVPYVYDRRPLRIESIAHGVPLHLLRERFVTTHIAATFGPATADGRLERVELWLTPEVPYGVARYHAIARGMEPFDVSVYSYGRHFRTDRAMSLRGVRAMTPDGSSTSTS